MSRKNFKFFGRLSDPYITKKQMDTLKHPAFCGANQLIKDSGVNKIVLLFPNVMRLLGGKFNNRFQGTGDCVAQGSATAVDMVKATEIVILKQFEEWLAETCVEDIYGGSARIIGRMSPGEGSYGIYAGQWVQKYGTLARGVYGKYDLTKYDYNRSINWRNGVGVPQELLPYAAKHKIKTVSLIRTYEEARDALANGYAVTIASNQGFTSTRDKEGFSKPYGNWAHQMCLIGVDDRGEGCSRRRPGVLCQNSWAMTQSGGFAPFNSGPKRHGQPDSSFWIDADVLEDNILSEQDSWAYSDYDGFVPKKINTRIV